MLLRCESLEPPMSQLGQKRRFRLVRQTSALPPKAAPKRTFQNRRLGPKAVCEQSQQGSPLFDHLVGGNEQSRWYGQAERLRSL